jgi:polysaccharide deacetylase family protein (PEP-CTERM system associated)
VLDVFDASTTKGDVLRSGLGRGPPSGPRARSSRGHEIGCHGYSHALIYGQSKDVFAEETHRAKSLLEDQAQQRVVGYRAASFSITEVSRWALDVIADAGFEYDSSMYPVKHDLYGTAVQSAGPHRIKAPNGATLVEFPMTTGSLFGVKLPISGGGYFRLYPYRLSAHLLNAVNRDAEPFVFYLHPWEFDPQQPRIVAPLKSRFRHYTNLHSCEAKVRTLLEDFQFAPMTDVLAAYPIAAASSS